MIIGLPDLASYRATLSGRVVATNGCFDLFHPGHLDSLRRARALGDHLIVGLNSDESVGLIKGSGRPIIGEAHRAEMLDALKCVSVVTVFDERTAERFLEAAKPHYWAKSSEYQDNVASVELEVLQGIGAKLVFLPTLAGFSTTELLGRVA